MRTMVIICSHILAPEEAPKAKVICPASNDHELKIKKLYRVHLFDGNYKFKNEGGNTKSEEVYCYACSKTLKF